MTFLQTRSNFHSSEAVLHDLHTAIKIYKSEV